MLERAKENNLKLNAEKCQFRVSELVFLGDKLTSEGVKPDPKKVSAIQNMPKPNDKTSLQRFLGSVTYLAKWIPNMSEISSPLRELLKEDNEWVWEHEHEHAFKKLIECISNEPTLAFYDPNKLIKLSSDASQNGLGAVLLQLHDNEWKPVSYASRTLTKSEKNYAQIEKELLSIHFACSRFYQFIYGARVQAETDHKSLIL